MAGRATAVLLVAWAWAAGGAGGQHCKQLASHYSVLATHDAAPGSPWHAALDVRRHAPAHAHAHFAVRPSAAAHAHKVTITLAGELPLERASEEDDGYEEAEHGGWYKVHRERVTWAEARAACEAEGAHLAVVDAPEEAAGVGALLARHAPHVSMELHAGFYAHNYAGSFVTEQGQPLSASGYEGWGPGQPDMSLCGRVDQQGLLRDGMCDWVEPASFLCERPPWHVPASAPAPAPPPVPTPALNATVAATVAPEGYEPVAPHGGKAAYKLHARPATWWAARAACAAEGARLAVLNSEAESYVVGELVRRAGNGTELLPYVYVGVSAHVHFVTIFGQSLSQARYDLWATGYPAFKNCVAVNHRGTLWVTQCWAKYPFVCEYEPSS